MQKTSLSSGLGYVVGRVFGGPLKFAANIGKNFFSGVKDGNIAREEAIQKDLDVVGFTGVNV